MEVVQDGTILLKWTLHLFPSHELPDLSCQLHKFLRNKITLCYHTVKCTFRMAKPSRGRRLADLKVDMAVGQPVGTSLIQEVNVFDQQTEERNHNLTG